MTARATPDELRLESDRSIAISTVAVILCLNLVVMMLDLGATGRLVQGITPVVVIRLVGVVLALTVTGVLSRMRTRRSLEIAVFFASIIVVGLVVAIRTVGAPTLSRVLAFDLVYIATLFVALPGKPSIQLVPVTLLGVASGMRLFDRDTPLALADRIYFSVIYLAAIAIGYLAAARREELNRDLCIARNAGLDAAKEAERAKLELQTLRGIIPICSYCHRVRLEDGRLWEGVDMYVSRRTDATFSHGVCPDCLVEHFPDLQTP